MRVHELKTESKYYQDVTRKNKKFEVRKDDRDFEVGDVVILKEIINNPLLDDVSYTGNECCTVIEYILRGFAGLAPGYCVLGIKKMYETKAAG